MKSTNKFVYVLLTSVLVFTSCCEKQNAEKPKEAISYKDAKILQQEYIETRANFINEYLHSINHFNEKGIKEEKENKESINSTPNKKEGLVKKENKIIEDVRDVTFDLETLKQYIAYVEKEAKSKGLKGLGLRVYLGAYPKGDTSVKDPGFTTVFFMPTHQPAAETTKGNNFFYWFGDEIIDGVDGLNLGSGGRPPHLNNL